jgi:hypothetical protein
MVDFVPYLPALTGIATIISAAAGLAGFLLGLVGYTKSRALQRRLLDKPYFVAKWPEMSQEIKNSRLRITSELFRIESHIHLTGQEYRRINNGHGTGVGFPFPEWIDPVENRQLINLKRYSWDYSPELRRLIMTHHRDLHAVAEAVSAYNSLLRPVHGPFRNHSSRGALIPSLIEVEYGHVPKSSIEVEDLSVEDKADFMRTVNLVKKYKHPLDEAMGYVANCPAFRKDAATYKSRLLDAIRIAEDSWVKVDALKHRFDALHLPSASGAG